MSRARAVPRRLRRRLTVATFLLSALVVAGTVLALIAALHADAQSSIRSRLADRSAALAATVDLSSGAVDIGGADDALLDSPNWVFDAAGARVEGAPLHGASGTAIEALGRSTTTRRGQVGTLHLLATPIRDRGRLRAVVVTGVDEAPYAATLDSTGRAAVLVGALAVLGATALAALVLSRTLGPMTAMTERAREWSRHEHGRRFALGPPRDELTGLAAVLDDLLDRVEEALTAERRLTAEIAHELRTPLTVLAGEADLALMDRSTPLAQRTRFERIRAAATAMSRAVTALLEEARTTPADASGADVRDSVRAVAGALPRRVRVDIRGDGNAAVQPGHLERILAPLLDNATRLAASAVVVRIHVADEVVVQIEDDGPGVDPAVEASLFDPGITTAVAGTGLGLALSRRLARGVDGDLRLLRARPAVFELRLPAAPAPEAGAVADGAAAAR